jgi:hypothetical protein
VARVEREEQIRRLVSVCERKLGNGSGSGSAACFDGSMGWRH